MYSTLDMRWLCTALEDVGTAAALAFSRLRALLCHQLCRRGPLGDVCTPWLGFMLYKFPHASDSR